jgi:23S rRNA pseudouridine1911/1915/1917 synthase
LTDAAAAVPGPWLPAAFNDGWAYHDRITALSQASDYYTARYPHSDQAAWRQRLAAGEIWCNGQQLWADGTLQAGDRLVWHRPPWQEAAVPVLPSPLFDDGDLVVFNKPSGLPVLPAGGFVRHTLLGQLEATADAALGAPRPVHRLGRFTSGLLVCARTAGARGWLSAQLRESTQAQAAPRCRKVYRALLSPPLADSPLLSLATEPGLEPLLIDTPIGRRPHPRLGLIWCAADPADPQALPSQSRVRLLGQGAEGWLVEVAISSGRPHQIRIHAAAAGAPLLGDPLYLPGGLARADALPGDGGYRLHAHRLSLTRPDGRALQLEAPLPPSLREETKR